MTVLHLFFSKAATMGYVFRSGKTIHFIDHQYATDNEDEIAEMTKECDKNDKGFRAFYTLPDQITIDSEKFRDPIAALREQIRQEELAKLIASDPTRDMGTSDSGKLNPLNSSQVYTTTAASNVQAEAAAANISAGVKVNLPGFVNVPPA